MDKPIELSVVLPAYLEEENLRILLPRLNQVLKDLGVSTEVIVVDTETPLDKTGDVCERNSCRYVPRVGGNTFGDAVRTGIAKIRGKYVIFMDADGSHPPEFIPELFACREQYDIVIASRYTKGGFTENSRVLVWMSRILNVSYSLILNIKCKDVSNSFKLYRGELLRSLTLKCDNFDIIEEILFKLCRQYRLKIKEVPFSFKKRMFGETKRNLLWFMVTYIFTMLKLRFSALWPARSRKVLGPARDLLKQQPEGKGTP